jgi:hypothetical protein
MKFRESFSQVSIQTNILTDIGVDGLAGGFLSSSKIAKQIFGKKI